VFLAVTSSDHRQAVSHPNYVMAAALGTVVLGGAALAAAVAGLRATGRGRAVLLAVAAGLADACSAVVTLGFSHVASHGVVALFTSWTIYALIVCGVGNVLLTQTAYQTGQPMITLPIIACVTPVASVAIGIGLLGETPHAGVAGGIAAGFAVLVTSVALAYLARSAPHPDPQGRESAGVDGHAVPRARAGDGAPEEDDGTRERVPALAGTASHRP
jgi:hypothetical protein